MVKSRNNLMDIFRLIGSLLVITIHINADNIFSDTLGRMVVPFFMLITSYFIFDSASLNWAKIKKTVVKIWALYAFWYIAYLPLTIYYYFHNSLSITEAIGKQILVGGGIIPIEHLWYLYCLPMGLIFVYLLRKLTFVLTMVSVMYLVYVYTVFLYPMYFSFLPKGLYHPFLIGFISAEFWATVGLFLSKNKKRIFQLNKSLLNSLLLIAIIFMMVEYIWLRRNGQFLSEVYISQIAASTLFFIWLLRTHVNINDSIGKLCAQYSALIYFIHMSFIYLIRITVPRSNTWSAFTKENEVLLFFCILTGSILFSKVYLYLSERPRFKILKQGI